MPIRAVIFDVSHTLINERNRVPAEGAVAALQRLRNLGVSIVAAHTDGPRAAVELVLTLAGGDLYQRGLFVYQEIPDAGDGKIKKQIPAQFIIEGDVVRFGLGAYDRNLPLTIDPVLSYATYLGGTSFDQIYSVTSDNAGNVYVAIRTASPGLTTTAAAYQTNSGSDNTFIAKLNPNATGAAQLVYGTYFGGIVTSIVVSGSDSIYVGGIAYPNSIATTPNAFQTSNRGGSDGFVARLNPNLLGSAQLVYATYYGGNDDDHWGNAGDLRVDSSGKIYFGNSTKSTNLTTTVGALQPTRRGNIDIFVVGFDPNLSGDAQLTYATYLGGTDIARFGAMALDASGKIYLVGTDNSATITTTANAYQTSDAGAGGFIVKLDPTATGANQLVYGSIFAGFLGMTALAVDNNNNIYFGGGIQYNGITTTVNAYQPNIRYSQDGYLVKLNLSLSGPAQLMYGTHFGAVGDESIEDLVVDAGGRIYITGFTSAADLPVTNGSVQSGNGGGFDSFVAIFNPNAKTRLGQLVYASYYGGVNEDFSQALTLNGNKLYMAGYTKSTNLTTTTNAYNPSYGGGDWDGFLVGLNLPSTSVSLTLSGTPNPAPYTSVVTFTATLNPSNATGQVIFQNGTTVLTTTNVVGGVAVYTTTSLSAGSYTIYAIYTGDDNYATVDTSLTQTITAGAPATITVVSGNNQSTEPGTSFSNPLVVSVKDVGNNQVSGVVVTFTAPASGASGTFANNSRIYTGTTDASGQVTTTVFTANNTLGVYTVTATVAGVANPANFQLATDKGAIRVYGQLGSFTSGTANNGGISAGTLNSPLGIVMDKQGGIYVSDTGNNRVLYYPKDAITPTVVYGQQGSFTTSTPNKGGVSAGSLYSPAGLALDSAGGLYVADANNNRVLYYPSGTLTATRVYGQNGSFSSNTANLGGTITTTNLAIPLGIALDEQNGVYISDGLNHRILYFANDGDTSADRVYGQQGSFTAGTENNGGVSAGSLNTPAGLTLDNQGNLYVADFSNHRVLYFPSGGITATRVYGQDNNFGSNSPDAGPTKLSTPLSVQLDNTGGVYISDTGNHRVLYFTNDGDTSADRVYGQQGSFTTNIPNKGGRSKYSLSRPYWMALDAAGGLYIADAFNNRVLYYASSCAPLIVRAISDDGKGSACGTLSYALVTASSGMTVTFALTPGNTITFTSNLTATVATGVIIDGGENGIVLNGNGATGDGLRLMGANRLLNLTIRGFAGREIVTNGTGNRFYRVYVTS
jgi:sugar lactone lactonase YvrE